jgi:iron uptake system component EfeO
MHVTRKTLLGLAAAATTVAGLTACGGAASPAASSTPAAPATAAVQSGAAVQVTLADFMITVPATVAAGPVTFEVTNNGPTQHQFSLLDQSGHEVGGTRTLDPKGTAQLQATLKPGTYMYMCDLPGHASLGMHGSFTVAGN